jgi:hypothetical protein
MTDKNNDKDLHPQILRMQKIAEENGGKLLDIEWEGARTKYRFLYDKNDESTSFTRTAENMLKIDRGWPNYKNNRVSFLKQKTKNKTSKEKLEEMQSLALSNNAKLISTEWVSTVTKYEFEIKENVVQIPYKYLLSKGWPKDLDRYINQSQKIPPNRTLKKLATINEIKLLAQKYNYELLSIGYEHRDAPLSFLDKLTNETFTMSYQSIKEGMLESKTIGKKGLIAEPICKQAIEHLLGCSFTKRKDILIPEITGRKTYLELDGYCEELKIAFEYQGHPSHWKTTHLNYKKVSEKDKQKKVFCNKLGIVLLQIPNFQKSKKFCEKEVIDTVIQTIEKEFKTNNKTLPCLNKENFIIDYSKINHAKYMLNKMKQLAVENNAVLLSKKWVGADKEYEFEKDNKKFKIRYVKLEEKGWPKNLDKFLSLSAGHKKSNTDLISEIEQYAEKNNLKLLDPVWVNINHKHSFKSLVNENHIIRLSKHNINKALKKNNNKSIESKVSFNIEKYNEKMLLRLAEHAKNNNAELVSKEWEGRYSYYEFKKYGKVILITYEYLSKKGFPKDIDKFLKQSSASKIGHKNRNK